MYTLNSEVKIIRHDEEILMGNQAGRQTDRTLQEEIGGWLD